jgi:hypothetical protein
VYVCSSIGEGVGLSVEVAEGGRAGAGVEVVVGVAVGIGEAVGKAFSS